MRACGSAALEHQRQKLPAHTAAASSVSRHVRVAMYGQPITQKSAVDVDACSSQHTRATSSPTWFGLGLGFGLGFGPGFRLGRG